MNYYISKIVNGNFTAVKEKAIKLLEEEGFAVKTEIDVTATLDAKLGISFKNYHILGACNADFAHQALLAEDKVGVLLPCNVILIEQEEGKIEVATMDAEAMMASLGNPALDQVAQKVNLHLSKVIDRM